MTIEGIGGTCPNCQYDRTFYRYGSPGWFAFDVCPKCGFAYGTAWGKTGTDEYTSQEVVEDVLHACGCATMEDLLAFAEAKPEDCVGSLYRDTGSHTVFNYDQTAVELFRLHGTVHVEEEIVIS